MLESFTEIAARWPNYAAWLDDLARSGEAEPLNDAGNLKGEKRGAPRGATGLAANILVPEMVALPPGHFMMGATPNDPDRRSDESPRHEVVITAPFAISITPITFEHWDACFADGGTRYRPEDNGWGRGNRPVINVSWHDAEEYIGWLNRKLDPPPEKRYRLLSEAEWEYAARAGHDGERFPWGEDLGCRQLEHYAWCYGNSDGRTQPVGGKPANTFGLSDMLGNVAEWVQDHYSSDYRPHAANGSPYLEDSRGGRRVLRGGSWLDPERMLRPVARECMNPDHRSYKIGFRIARNL